jgi:hypothetical protein
MARRASEIAYSQAIQSPDANEQPPSSDGWEKIEAERLRKLGLDDLIPDSAETRRTIQERRAREVQEQAEAIRRANDEFDRHRQEKVERALDEWYRPRRRP